MEDLVLRPIHNTTQNNVLRCVAFASPLVETQYNARIDFGAPLRCILASGSQEILNLFSNKFVFRELT